MPAGRPPIFNTAEEMQQAVDNYFAECVADDDIVTVCGLALALGMTRETLCSYGKNDKFSDTVKIAKMRVENYIEKRLMGTGNATGAIFNLKNNFGWKDRSEIDQTTNLNVSSVELIPLTSEDTTTS